MSVVVTCPACSREHRLPNANVDAFCFCSGNPEPLIHRCKSYVPVVSIQASPKISREPVGDSLKEIIKSKGYQIQHNSGCKCDEHIDQMNQWGIAGCRENIELIVDWLEESAKGYTVGGKFMHVPGLRGVGRQYLRRLTEEAIAATVPVVGRSTACRQPPATPPLAG